MDPEGDQLVLIRYFYPAVQIIHELRRHSVNAKRDQLARVGRFEPRGTQVADELRRNTVNSKRQQFAGIQAPHRQSLHRTRKFQADVE